MVFFLDYIMCYFICSIGLIKGQRQNAASCMPKIYMSYGQKKAVSGVFPNTRSIQGNLINQHQYEIYILP